MYGETKNEVINLRRTDAGDRWRLSRAHHAYTADGQRNCRRNSRVCSVELFTTRIGTQKTRAAPTIHNYGAMNADCERPTFYRMGVWWLLECSRRRRLRSGPAHSRTAYSLTSAPNVTADVGRACCFPLGRHALTAFVQRTAERRQCDHRRYATAMADCTGGRAAQPTNGHTHTRIRRVVPRFRVGRSLVSRWEKKIKRMNLISRFQGNPPTSDFHTTSCLPPTLKLLLNNGSTTTI